MGTKGTKTFSGDKQEHKLRRSLRLQARSSCEQISDQNGHHRPIPGAGSYRNDCGILPSE